MATLTIRNLDESAKRRLRVRAAERGVSMEEDARLIIRDALAGAFSTSAIRNDGGPQRPDRYIDMTAEELLAFGRISEKPMSLKKLSDEMWDESL